MGAITDLWKSERGIVAIAGLILVTVVFALGRITPEQWEALIKWVFVGYTGAKTATSVATIVKGSTTAGALPPATPSTTEAAS